MATRCNRQAFIKIVTSQPVSISVSNPQCPSSLLRGRHWDGGTNPRGCTLTTMPTVTHLVHARSARTGHEMEESHITCARRRMWLRSWTTVPVPTGLRGRRACWACRTSSRAKEYWGGGVLSVGYKNTYARNMCFSIWGLVIVVIIVFLQSGSKVHTNHF